MILMMSSAWLSVLQIQAFLALHSLHSRSHDSGK
jgi:hypothetical protein